MLASFGRSGNAMVIFSTLFRLSNLKLAAALLNKLKLWLARKVLIGAESEREMSTVGRISVSSVARGGKMQYSIFR